MLDRIDLHVETPAVAYAEMTGPAGEASAAIAARVLRARVRQAERIARSGTLTNAEVPATALRAVAAPDEAGARLLAWAMERLGLTGRTHDRLLRVARTIADLEGVESVGAAHVAEALQFRRCNPDTG